MILTELECLCISYLSALMEANVGMIAEAMSMTEGGARGFMVRLKNRGLVYRLPELRAWRLTATGRAIAAQIKCNRN